MADNIVYVGDAGGDNFLNVTFYKGMHEGKEMDFIRIQSPGDQHNVIDTAVQDHHKRRFALRWEQYKNGDSEKGTPIEDWPELAGTTLADFKNKGFRFIEQVANAPDSAFASIMGGIQWRNRANKFLGALNSSNSDIVKAQAERIAELEKKMEAILAPTSVSTDDRPRRGRPVKE